MRRRRVGRGVFGSGLGSGMGSGFGLGRGSGLGSGSRSGLGGGEPPRSAPPARKVAEPAVNVAPTSHATMAATDFSVEPSDAAATAVPASQSSRDVSPTRGDSGASGVLPSEAAAGCDSGQLSPPVAAAESDASFSSPG
ncbi:MAG: hypothetical protein EOP37_17495 [Rubrivivax sp.]|nr:MAG: hypothetical protein EOP37_17495 [Rubrivivax sp.]